MRDPDVELARRLCAATLSYQMGNKSLDYTYKQYASGELGEYWLVLARQVQEDTAVARAKQLGLR